MKPVDENTSPEECERLFRRERNRRRQERRDANRRAAEKPAIDNDFVDIKIRRHTLGVILAFLCDAGMSEEDELIIDLKRQGGL